MEAKIRALRKDGRNLNGDQLKGVPRRVGILRVTEDRDIELNRPMVRARLLDPTRTSESDLLPPLDDARLLFLDKGKMRLTGIERLAERDVAQTWDVRLD
jgi:hypothetical protein